MDTGFSLLKMEMCPQMCPHVDQATFVFRLAAPSAVSMRGRPKKRVCSCATSSVFRTLAVLVSAASNSPSAGRWLAVLPVACGALVALVIQVVLMVAGGSVAPVHACAARHALLGRPVGTRWPACAA